MNENEFNNLVFETTNGVVQNGLFKNLKYAEKRDRIHNKILGLYENQLQIFIKDAILKNPDIVINIGCGDGYYGLGLAKILNNCKSILVDTSEDELIRAKNNARINNLNNVSFLNDITDEELIRLVNAHSRPFVFIDIEGAEHKFLDHIKYECLSKCIIMIETHDFIYRNITSLLINRFSASHKVYIINDTEKHIMDDFLNNIELDDKLAFQSEGRPQGMKWIYLSPK